MHQAFMLVQVLPALLRHLDMYTLIAFPCFADIPDDAATKGDVEALTAGAIRNSGETGIHRGLEGGVGACGEEPRAAQHCSRYAAF
jgi:hypothetical protein